MKYKVGQKVKIIANNSRHDFNIGDIVEIKNIDYTDNQDGLYLAQEPNSEWEWLFSDSECELAEYSNADKFRAMNDDELVLWIMENVSDEHICNLCSNPPYKNNVLKCSGKCSQGIMEWLKKDANE